MRTCMKFLSWMTVVPDLVILIEIGSSMARDSHVRERLFFAHSDPHGAALFNG
jgi:hypothetical protein